MVSKKTFFSISLVGFWSLLTSQTNIFLECFWFLELGDFRQATTKKPKTQKTIFWNRILGFREKKKKNDSLVSLEFFWFLLVSSKECLVFWFWMLKNKKKTSFFGFWSLLTSKANIFLEFFWFLELATSGNQRKQTPFRGNPKKPKKLQGNQRIKTFPWNQEFKFCSKMFFFVFWFLGGIRMIIFKGYTCYSRYVSHYLKPKYTETYRWMDGLVDCLNIRSILYICIYIYLSIWYTYIHTYIYIYIWYTYTLYIYIYIETDIEISWPFPIRSSLGGHHLAGPRMAGIQWSGWGCGRDGAGDLVPFRITSWMRKA